MRQIVLVAMACLMASAGLAAGVETAPAVKLAADLWCPYNCDPHADRPGYVVDMVRDILAAAGRTIDYQVVAWPRAIADARAGHYDAVLCATPDDALDFLYPHEPIGFSRLGIAVAADSAFHFTGTASFEGHVIGTVAGYALAGETGKYIRAHEKDPTRVQFVAGNDALAKNLRKLAAGHIDIVIDDSNVLAHSIAELGLSAHMKIAYVTPGSPLYVAISPSAHDGPLLAQMLNDGIARLRASGRLAILLARYHVHDWK